jgi:REP element-mobilizing transposase RayT
MYHVTCRLVGSWREDRAWLFRDDGDRERFLDQLAERVEQREIRLFLYSLMANHFHLAFETPRGNCSSFMQGLLTAYTVYFNRRHERHGHLMDGRYKAKLVEGDEYLLSLSRYVHLNPVRVKGMQELPLPEQVKVLRSYRWSSYPGYIGRRKPLELVTYGPILGMMAGRKKEWAGRYRQFVEMGLAEEDEEFAEVLSASPRSIGGEGFRTWVDRLHEAELGRRTNLEDISFRRTTEGLAPGVVLGVVAEVLGEEVRAFRRRRRNSPMRAVAARYLMQYSGLTQREVARELHAGSGSAISKQLAGFGAYARKEKRLTRQLHAIEKRLETLRKEGSQDVTNS